MVSGLSEITCIFMVQAATISHLSRQHLLEYAFEVGFASRFFKVTLSERARYPPRQADMIL